MYLKQPTVLLPQAWLITLDLPQAWLITLYLPQAWLIPLDGSGCPTYTFDFIARKIFYFFWLRSLSTLSVPGDGYSTCAILWYLHFYYISCVHNQKFEKPIISVFRSKKTKVLPSGYLCLRRGCHPVWLNHVKEGPLWT